ncbi:MAG TPA: DUF2306 domain-containing protein, partial [Leptospiraceae bacterium]|nr:DUF2306 domain-containing protein [Leptospiraceae bacterium]
MKKSLTGVFRDFLIYVFLCVGTFLMLRIIAEYVTFSTTAGFLKQKQDYISIPIWKAAFYTHVFSSVFTLLAGFTQFSSYILTNFKKLHKVLGRFYAWNIFLINFPSGFIMAIYANGY